MNAAHLHLVLNHFPIVGVVFAIPVLLLGWLLRREDFSRAGLLIVVLAGILTIPAFFTGESAEDIVERLPNVSAAVIERHEEAAKVALGLMSATAILGAIGLVAGFMKKNVLRVLVPLTLLACLVSTVALAWTNNLGGQIQHSEISTNGTPGQAPSGNAREHDD